jgi:hypothetical protein
MHGDHQAYHLEDYDEQNTARATVKAGGQHYCTEIADSMGFSADSSVLGNGKEYPET